MADLETVFRGVYDFCFDFPDSEKYGIIRFPGFAAAWTLSRLEVMQADGAPNFSYAQAIAVSRFEGYGFYDKDSGSVLAYSDAVRWVLCFPVIRQPNGKYTLKASKLSTLKPAVPRDRRTLCGEHVFFCFSSAIENASNGKTFRAASSLDCLDLLSPKPGDKLVLVRASRWRWAKFYNTAVIKPKYVLDAETVSDSEVRMIDSEERERNYEWDCE